MSLNRVERACQLVDDSIKYNKNNPFLAVISKPLWIQVISGEIISRQNQQHFKSRKRIYFIKGGAARWNNANKTVDWMKERKKRRNFVFYCSQENVNIENPLGMNNTNFGTFWPPFQMKNQRKSSNFDYHWLFPSICRGSWFHQ